jgi:hypothetical protein
VTASFARSSVDCVSFTLKNSQGMVSTHVCLTVRLNIREIVLVAAEPETKACLLPKLLKVCLSFFFGVVEL